MTSYLSIGQFLSTYNDLFMPIWEYAFDPIELDNSIKCMESLIPSQYDSNKYKVYIIKHYLDNVRSSDLTDIGVNMLLKNKFMSNTEFNLISYIFLDNRYKPSIDNTLRNYLEACIKGSLGIVELTFKYLQNNYINIIDDKLKQRLVHWMILQYGHNSTEYRNVSRFTELSTFTKPFDIENYSYNDFNLIIQEHIEMFTVDFLIDNIGHKHIDPINICLISEPIYNTKNVIGLNRLYQIILPSFQKILHIINFDNLKININNNIVDVIKKFINYCRSDHDVNTIKTVYDYLKLIINDDIIVWLIICYCINISSITQNDDILSFLIQSKNNLEMNNGMILHEKIILLNKYIKFHRYLLSDLNNQDDVNVWKCNMCTFENTNIIKRLCDVCEYNRFT